MVFDKKVWKLPRQLYKVQLILLTVSGLLYSLCLNRIDNETFEARSKRRVLIEPYSCQLMSCCSLKIVQKRRHQLILDFAGHWSDSVHISNSGGWINIYSLYRA